MSEQTRSLGPFGAPVPAVRGSGDSFEHDELNLFDSTAVAVSSVAPAYSPGVDHVRCVFVIVGVGSTPARR